MAELFSRVLNMSLTGSIIILFVLAARVLLRRSPRVYSYALWSAVLFRLLCPVALSSPISLLGILKPQVRTVAPLSSTVTFVPVPAAPPQSLPQITAVPATAAAPVSLLAILGWIWFAGFLGLMLYSLVGFLRLRRSLVGAVVFRGDVYLCDHIASPFVMGILRPRAYLPSGIAKEDRRFIIAHERRHIRRWDPLWKLLGYAAVCLHWFNPLVWLAFVLAGRDMEMSCDEAVIRQLGEDIRADYSAALLRFAAPGHAVGIALAFGESDIKQRIRNMARQKKRTLAATVLCILLCAAVLVFCLLNPRSGGSTDPRVSGPAAIHVGPVDFTIPQGFTYSLREDGSALLLQGETIVGGLTVYSVPEGTNPSGWDWLHALPLEEWQRDDLGHSAGGSLSQDCTAEFFTDVPPGTQVTEYRRTHHFLADGSSPTLDTIYDLWFDELTVDPTARDNILHSLQVGPVAPRAVLVGVPYEIGALPEGYYQLTGSSGEILFTNGSTIVGGITGYAIPEGVYDPRDSVFLWLEDVGIPDYEDSSLIFSGGITDGDTGWCAYFTENVPNPSVKRVHHFQPYGSIVYDFWMDELLVKPTTQYAFVDAVRFLGGSPAPAPVIGPEEAFAKCGAVLEAVQAGNHHVVSQYRYDLDPGKDRTLEYRTGTQGYLLTVQTADGQKTDTLYTEEQSYVRSPGGQWKAQGPADAPGSWLGRFYFVQENAVYLDTWTDSTGTTIMFQANVFFEDAPEFTRGYSIDFHFDPNGNFENVELFVTLTNGEAFTLRETIQSLDAAAIDAEIESSLREAAQ